MIHHGTDWNRHRGVGATLLENWVEERAVGDLIIEERTDLPFLSRQGHKVILKIKLFIYKLILYFNRTYSFILKKTAALKRPIVKIFQPKIAQKRKESSVNVEKNWKKNC